MVLNGNSEGASRIRVTTGAMTGTMLLGDNFSLKGSYPGNQTVRDQAEKVVLNASINALAQLGRSFRPVEGNMPVNFSTGSGTYGVEKAFMLDTDNALYLAVFNYDASKEATETINLTRLGVNVANVKRIKELWTDTSVNPTGKCEIPAGDVRVYCFEKKKK